MGNLHNMHCPIFVFSFHENFVHPKAMWVLDLLEKCDLENRQYCALGWCKICNNWKHFVYDDSMCTSALVVHPTKTSGLDARHTHRNKHQLAFA